MKTKIRNTNTGTRLAKAWTAIDRLSVIWKSDLTDKMKRSFFQAAAGSILLYGCTAWTLTKRMEKKLDGNDTRMLWTILNKSWRQHPTKQKLYGHQPSITKTIKIRRSRHAGHCWRSRYELISDVLLWTLSHWRAKAGRLARTYLQQLCADTGCSSEDPWKQCTIGRGGERGSGYPCWWRDMNMIYDIIEENSILQLNSILGKWLESIIEWKLLWEGFQG